MTAKMVGFSLPKYAVVPTDKAIIESALPAGYHLQERMDGEYDIFYNATAGIRIGTVAMVADEIVFDLVAGNPGLEFVKNLKTRYPEYDEDRILWAIFYQWYGEWAMEGSPISETDSKEFVNRLSGLTDFQLTRNPVLCTFRAGDCVGNNIPTLSTKKILSNWELGEDQGPILIELSNLESCHGESTEETSGLE